MEEPSLAHIEALPGNGLPFVETGLAEGHTFGAGLQAGFAVGLKVDDIVHFGHSNAESIKTGSIDLEENVFKQDLVPSFQTGRLRIVSGVMIFPSDAARYKCTCRAGRGMVQTSAGWRRAAFKRMKG
jgi:hypothetical protein